MAWRARRTWRKEAGWVTANEQRLAQRQKKLAGGSPGGRIERRAERKETGSRWHGVIDNGDFRL